MSSAYEEAQAAGSSDTSVTAPASTVARRRFSPTAALNLQTFSSLRHRDFALLWTGAAIMSAGQWLQQITLSWLVFEMTGSAFYLGLINGLRTVPYLLIGLFSGTIADRMDRRLLMMITQTYLVATTAVVAVLLVTGTAELWHLLVFSLASGAGWAFVWPVRQAVIPTIVPREELLTANALMMSAMNLMRIIGPAVGGFLLVAFGGGGNFSVQVVLYASVIIMIAMMKVPPVPERSGPRPSVMASTAEGLRYVRSKEILVTLLMLMVVPMTLAMPYMSLLAIFAGDVYDIGALGLGIMLSFGGIGSLIGTLGLASVGDVKRKGMTMAFCLAAMGIALILFSQAPWLALAIVFLMIVNMFQVTFVTLNQTVLQATITDDMRGRVASLHMLEYGLIPAGVFAAGGAADVIGAPNTISIMGGIVTLIALVTIWRARTLRRA